MIAVLLIVLLFLILLFAIIDLLFGSSLNFPGKKLYFTIAAISLIFSFFLAERGALGAGPYNAAIDLIYTYVLVIIVFVLVRIILFVGLSVPTFIVFAALLAIPLIVRIASKNIYS